MNLYDHLSIVDLESIDFGSSESGFTTILFAQLTNVVQISPVGLNVVLSHSGFLSSNTLYFYTVTCVNALGESVGPEVSVRTSLTDLTVTISWIRNTDATSYRIYRGIASGSEDKLVTEIFDNSIVSFIDDGSSSSTASPPGTNTSGLGIFSYSWTEQTFNTLTGIPSDAVSARQGDYRTGPYLVEVNNTPVTVPLYAWIRLRGNVGDLPFYEFSAGSQILPYLRVEDGISVFIDNVTDLKFNQSPFEIWTLTSPSIGKAVVTISTAAYNTPGVITSTDQYVGGGNKFFDTLSIPITPGVVSDFVFLTSLDVTLTSPIVFSDTHVYSLNVQARHPGILAAGLITDVLMVNAPDVFGLQTGVMYISGDSTAYGGTIHFGHASNSSYPLSPVPLGNFNHADTPLMLIQNVSGTTPLSWFNSYGGICSGYGYSVLDLTGSFVVHKGLTGTGGGGDSFIGGIFTGAGTPAGAPPTGPAGGALTGSYPNPTIPSTGVGSPSPTIGAAGSLYVDISDPNNPVYYYKT